MYFHILCKSDSNSTFAALAAVLPQQRPNLGRVSEWQARGGRPWRSLPGLQSVLLRSSWITDYEKTNLTKKWINCYKFGDLQQVINTEIPTLSLECELER